MEIETIVRVTFPGDKAINLTTDLVWMIPHEEIKDRWVTLVKLVKYKSQICRLLGQPMLSSGPEKRKLQFTSIIETLQERRNEFINAMIDVTNAKENKVDLDIDDPNRRKTGNKATHGKEHRTLAIISKVDHDRCAGRRRHQFPPDKGPP